MDLSVVIVSWNVRNLLRECLESVYAEASALAQGHTFDIQVFVVDNASSDGSAEMVAQLFPQVKLVTNTENVGFTRGNNQALRLATGRHVLLLNPDCIVQQGAMGGMIRYLDTHAEIGVVGPKLLFPDGTVQSSRRRFPTMATGLVESTVLQPLFKNSTILKRYYCLDQTEGIEQEVDWLVGACLLIRGKTLRQVGLLDEDFFMYSEELDWCFRAKKAGWKVVYLHDLSVIHHEGKSSEQNLVGRNIHFHDSKCRFFSKHYGTTRGFTLRLFIFLTFIYQIAEESAKYVLVSNKRPLHKNRVAMLVKVSGHQFKGLLRTGR